MIRFSKITHNVRALFPKVRHYFTSKPDVEFAYLYGSYGEGKEGPLSDGDIAVFLTKEVPPDNYFELRLRMMTDMFKILKTDEVDLIILNEVNLSLTYHAISKSTVLFERDPRVRIEFQVRTMDRSFDTKPFRQVQYESLLRRIQEG
ncbi:MAG: nucleotidyltransferase domain-containing protein [Ignavibacteriae bacterium]|nr:nucleotidyltransferase domain-containing protein [Ignavibacteriota bacterium]